MRCWAFSPPGGTAGPEVAEAVSGFCTSVVIGKDWIPRLTLDTFERLRDQMVLVLCSKANSKPKPGELQFFNASSTRRTKEGVLTWGKTGCCHQRLLCWHAIWSPVGSTCKMPLYLKLQRLLKPLRPFLKETAQILPVILSLLCLNTFWLGAQIVSAVRSKKSKWRFLLGLLSGRRWEEADLFMPFPQVASIGALV